MRYYQWEGDQPTLQAKMAEHHNLMDGSVRDIQSTKAWRRMAHMLSQACESPDPDAALDNASKEIAVFKAAFEAAQALIAKARSQLAQARKEGKFTVGKAIGTYDRTYYF
jgi:hypothetical protein